MLEKESFNHHRFIDIQRSFMIISLNILNDYLNICTNIVKSKNNGYRNNIYADFVRSQVLRD